MTYRTQGSRVPWASQESGTSNWEAGRKQDGHKSASLSPRHATSADLYAIWIIRLLFRIAVSTLCTNLEG